MNFDMSLFLYYIMFLSFILYCMLLSCIIIHMFVIVAMSKDKEVMKVERYDEFMLAFAFDHLNGDEKTARWFLIKKAKLRKFWLMDNFLKNHGN
jgi:hypothetical protein